MKYLIVLADGMADEKIESLGNKTPLQVSKLPAINGLAKKGEVGLVNTIPEGMEPGSDIANLSVLGYAPEIYHTGRSPLEAVSMGIELSPTDITFRCNLVTVSENENYEEKKMIDHSSGDISSEEAEVLIGALNEHFATDEMLLYPGVSYRHALVWKDGPNDFKMIPPHDILEQTIGGYLPQGGSADVINNMMKKSYDILSNHPVNIARKEKGLNPANLAWIWGHGTKPSLESFKNRYGVTGSVISAVDLIKGIGICAGLDSIDVEGATGNLHTNFIGKADAVIEEFKKGKDFVFLHIEAPDECGHQGDLEGKIKSMEIIDVDVVNKLVNYLKGQEEDYKVLVLPDHPTPVELRTHTSKAVPFVLYDSTKDVDNQENAFDEISAESGLSFDTGHGLTDYFFKDIK